MHASVATLLERCPFLGAHLDADWLDLPTVAYGATATAISRNVLSDSEKDAVFAWFNDLAEHGTSEDLEILGTGAIEMFNDSAPIQRLARAKLRGPALALLERYRLSWGQPDYGGGS